MKTGNMSEMIGKGTGNNRQHVRVKTGNISSPWDGKQVKRQNNVNYL